MRHKEEQIARLAEKILAEPTINCEASNNSAKKIIIFPEGTRTKTGALGEFKKMFAILSKEINVPVVPVAIQGAYNALPMGKKIPRLFSKVEVNFMQPIYPQNYTHDSLVNEVYRAIQNKISNK